MKATPKKKTKAAEDVQENASPVCYAGSAEIQPAYVDLEAPEKVTVKPEKPARKKS